MQNQRSVLPSMLALPRGWNDPRRLLPYVRIMIAYPARKVNIRRRLQLARRLAVMELCNPYKIGIGILAGRAVQAVKKPKSQRGRLRVGMTALRFRICAPRTKILPKFCHAGRRGAAGFAFALPRLPEKPLCGIVLYFLHFARFSSCIRHFRSDQCHQKNMPSEKGSRTGAGVRLRVHHVCRCGIHGSGGY